MEVAQKLEACVLLRGETTFNPTRLGTALVGDVTLKVAVPGRTDVRLRHHTLVGIPRCGEGGTPRSAHRITGAAEQRYPVPKLPITCELSGMGEGRAGLTSTHSGDGGGWMGTCGLGGEQCGSGQRSTTFNTRSTQRSTDVQHDDQHEAFRISFSIGRN